MFQPPTEKMPFPTMTSNTRTDGTTPPTLAAPPSSSHNHNHNNNNNTISQISTILATTLQALTNDAQTVRQMTSLYHQQKQKHPSHDDDDDDDDEDDEWVPLEALVTTLEDKVMALRAMVLEEQAALQDFGRGLATEGDTQADLVHQLQQVCDSILTTTTTSSSSSTSPKTPKLRPVTAEELLLHSYQGQQRLSLPLVNEALDEIQALAATSAVPRVRRFPTTTTPSSTWQRKYDYLQQRRRRREPSGSSVLPSNHDNHNPLVVVTEQAMREHCAFFRHGEATARTILTLLCALYRLRQVKGGVASTTITTLSSSSLRQQQLPLQQEPVVQYVLCWTPDDDNEQEEDQDEKEASLWQPEY